MAEKSKNKTEVQFGYKVAKINTTQFSFTDMDEEAANLIFENDEQFRTDISVNINFHLEKSEISFEIKTSIQLLSTNEILISHSGKTVYSVDQLEKAYNKKLNQFLLPDALIVQIYGIAFSHTRALLAVELNGTIYRDKFLLPIIDPRQILNKK